MWRAFAGGGCRPYLCQVDFTTIGAPHISGRLLASGRPHVVGPTVRGCDDLTARSALTVSDWYKRTTERDAGWNCSGGIDVTLAGRSPSSDPTQRAKPKEEDGRGFLESGQRNTETRIGTPAGRDIFPAGVSMVVARRKHLLPQTWTESRGLETLVPFPSYIASEKE
ncbi:hypothetical protein B296_00004685 [Ensete ventricosum]|uniref:Uncharacterized protein n=1 Tax=Ensete ventricosum TaxID=4639 RepID=A0A426YWH6_ENSVE|nr:hypothetical protein B296_00004685 [Ensete ventricosum]